MAGFLLTRISVGVPSERPMRVELLPAPGDKTNDPLRRIFLLAAHPGEGPFSIAASVKLRPDDFMLAPFPRSGCSGHTGLSLLFEVGVRPPHDGMRRMGR